MNRRVPVHLAHHRVHIPEGQDPGIRLNAPLGHLILNFGEKRSGIDGKRKIHLEVIQLVVLLLGVTDPRDTEALGPVGIPVDEHIGEVLATSGT